MIAERKGHTGYGSFPHCVTVLVREQLYCILNLFIQALMDRQYDFQMLLLDGYSYEMLSCKGHRVNWELSVKHRSEHLTNTHEAD